jgi:hypothetical protein
MNRALTGPERLAMLATEYAGCSAHVDRDRFAHVIAGPSDLAPERLDALTGAHPPRTSGLFALGLLRLAGLPDRVLLAPHRAGLEGVNLQAIGHAHGAWVEGACAAPFQAGDIWLVIGPPWGVHVGVCVSEARVLTDGSWEVDTVEGGQVEAIADWPKNASAIRAFNGDESRRFVWRRGAPHLGDAVLFGVLCADALGIESTMPRAEPLDVEADDDEGDTQNASASAAADPASLAAAKELPIAPVPASIATVRIRKGKTAKGKSTREVRS